MSTRLMMALPLLCSLVACGGGGGGGGVAAPPQPFAPSAPAPSPAASATAQIQLTIPTSATESSARAPQFVSPATNSLRITVDGAAPTIISLPGNPGCTMTSSGRSCTIALSLPTGIITLTISTFASIDASGPALATGASAATIATGVTNTVSIALHPIVSALGLSLTPNVLAVGTAASSSVTISALDAAGALIPAGANVVDAANAPVSFSLTDSDTSGATSLSAPNASGLATLHLHRSRRTREL